MNKKILYLSLLGVILSSFASPKDCNNNNCGCDCKVLSHTFFSARPVYQILSPEYLVHSRDFFRRYDNCHGGSIQITPLGGKSTRDRNLEHFFLPVCKTVLNVNEQPLDGTDVLASYLNIYTVNQDFQSQVEFKPRHSFIGAGFNYQHRFYEICDGHGLWFSISGPILRVRNRVEIVERIINPGGGAISSAPLQQTFGTCPDFCPNSCNEECIQDPSQALQPVGSVEAAFAQPGWCFGRVDNNICNRKDKVRFGDVTVRLGYETSYTDCCHWDSFIGFIAPTGNKPRAIELFEPMVGHNHHWGITIGSNVALYWQRIWCDVDVWYALDLAFTQLFSRKERRSFDLKNKPWSRYMQFYKNFDQAQLAATSLDPNYAFILHTPGINILTQEIKVKPGYYAAINGALIFDRNCWQLEIGYNFYARQAECLRFDKECPFPTGAAIKAIDLGAGMTGRYQVINSDFGNNCAGSLVANYNSNIITAADVDLESAAHPAVLSNTIYGSLSYDFASHCGYPILIAAGGSYEFPSDNAGLRRWMAWGKLGIAF